MRTGRRNSAWIPGALSEERRREVEKSLEKILPGSAEQRRQFLATADEEIDAYRKLHKVGLVDDEKGRLRLRAFARTARAFAKAFAALDRYDMSAIRTGLLMMKRRKNRSDNEVEAGAQFRDADTEFAEIACAGRVAPIAADAADAASREGGAPRKLGAPIDAADRGLVKRIADCYARIFGERPSAADEGIFSRALRAIFAGADLKLKLRAKRLEAIINGSAAGTAAAPKRGPKPRPAK